MQIAVLEDTPRVADVLKLALESGGHTVRLFQNVKGVLDFFPAPECVDLLIVDYRLETDDNFNGTDVIRQVREINPNIPALVISAMPLFVLESATRGLSRVKVMCKPFHVLDLLETVQALNQ